MLAKLTAVRLGIAFILLLLFSPIFAQRKVSGKVSGPDGKPVFGATVSVRGSRTATSTSTEGTFTIQLTKNQNTLIISFVGFETQEVNVSGKDDIQVSMKEQRTDLNEVVVTGYTTQKVKEITGSVGLVKAKDLTSIPAGQVGEQLQGRVAGLNITNSGQPGQGAQISLAGVGNFGNVTPLYIIDGVQGDINNINPNDVESIQVLKDAGTASIYGVRAANGVIIINTKRGKAGRTIVTYDSYVGTQQPLSNGWGLLDTKGRAALYDLAVANTTGAAHNNPQYGPGPNATIPYWLVVGNQYGLTNPGDTAGKSALYNVDWGAGSIYQIVKANQQGTDWFHELFKPALQTSHTLSVAGGGDKNHYLFSFGYLDQKGTFLGTYLKRYTLRFNSDFVIKNNIHIGENIEAIYRDNPRTGILGETNIGMTYREQPIIPVYDAFGGYAGTRAAGLGNAQNPVANAKRALNNKGLSLAVLGNVYAQVDFLKYFNFRTTFGGTLDNFYYYNYGYHSYENAENNSSNSFSENGGYNRNWTWNNLLTFSKTFLNDHTVKALVGTEAIENYGRGVGGTRYNYFSDDPNYRILDNGSPTGQSNYSYAYTSALSSVLGRLEYGYKDKYFVNGVFRRDGSSVFGPNSRYGNFYSVSAAWRVTEESFAKSLTTWLTDLKIRGSYGIMGFNGNTDPLNQYTLFGSSPGLSYYDITGSSTSTVQGFYAQRIGNPATGWQEDKKMNFGFDAILLKGKYTISADYWQKKSSKLLFPISLPAVLGGATAPNVNTGQVDNHGFDLILGTSQNINRDWKIDVNAALTTYKNKITDIPGLPYFDAGGLRNGNAVRNQVGHPISAFYGYKVVGLFQDAASAAASNQPDAKPGRFKYLDVNGDKQITTDDRTFIGNPNPKASLGLNISITYKQFDFTTFFYGTFGNDIYNYTKYWIDFYQGFEGNKSTRALNESWTPTRKGNTVPIQEFSSNFSSDGQVNSYYVEKGSYFRNKSLILGYTLPASLIKKAGLDKARIYIQATNLFTITKYSGLDPEVQGTTAATGIDYGNYPANQKQYLVGVSVSF